MNIINFQLYILKYFYLCFDSSSKFWIIVVHFILVVWELCLCFQWKCSNSKLDCWWAMWTSNRGDRSHSCCTERGLWNTEMQHTITSIQSSTFFPQWNTRIYFMWTQEGQYLFSYSYILIISLHMLYQSFSWIHISAYFSLYNVQVGSG